MPELPEVEQFRRLLVPLVSETKPLRVSLEGINPPRKWISESSAQAISGAYKCKCVLRKGKQICLVLVPCDKQGVDRYLFLHMGMTGRISTPARSVKLENLKEDASKEFPPPFTYLLLQSGDYTTAFSDSRKFGSCTVSNDTSLFDVLASDALDTKETEIINSKIIPKLEGQRKSIKSILLDQKLAISGVGNWVADECLYQSRLHPEQCHLSRAEASQLFCRLQSILVTAVDCLQRDLDYPDNWLFRYRWTKKRVSKDFEGRTISFIQCAGRTAAVVTSIQLLRQPRSATKRPMSVEQLPSSEETKRARPGLPPPRRSRKIIGSRGMQQS